MLLRDMEIKESKSPAIHIEFYTEEERNMFGYWLRTHGFDMYKSWVDDDDAQLTYDEDDHRAYVVDGETWRGWEEDNEYYRRLSEQQDEDDHV